MANYHKGRRAERASVRMHKARGACLVVRAAGSKSLGDVVVFDQKRKLVSVVQCKAGKMPGNRGLNSLVSLAQNIGGGDWTVEVVLEHWHVGAAASKPKLLNRYVGANQVFIPRTRPDP